MQGESNIDLFNLNGIESVVGSYFRKKGPINLNDLAIPVFEISSDYVINQFKFTVDEYAEEIRAAINPIVRIAEDKGFPPHLFTAMYEAVLNAYQHGNNRNPEKKVTIADKIEDDKADIFIIDQGGILNPEFMPFVLRHRTGEYKKKFIDFYEFTQTPKDKRPKDNEGTGTSFMHTYTDEVRYYKSKEGGLVVHLIKQKSKQI